MPITDLRALAINMGFALRTVLAALFDDILLGVPSVLGAVWQNRLRRLGTEPRQQNHFLPQRGESESLLQVRRADEALRHHAEIL